MTDPSVQQSTSVAAPAAAGLTANGDPPAATVVFGVVLDVGGTAVPITTADVGSALTNGVEFTLPQPVTLGDFHTFQKWVSDTFSVTLPDASSLPSPLNTVVGKLEDLSVTVNEAHIKVPGSSGGDKQYTLSVSATWPPDGEVPLFAGISLAGFVFGASNEKPKATS